MEMRCRVDTDCAPDRVWPFIEDSEKQRLWMKGLVENVPTSEGPTRAGSTFRMRIREGGKEVDDDGEVITLRPVSG